MKKYSDATIQTTNEGKAISVLNQRNPNYASMVHSTDENIGRLISFLKDKNLYDNTLIIFTSDNGGLSTQDRVAPTSTKPLRAGKGWLYEGGIRIPQLIKFVNQKNQHLNDNPVVSYDLFATVVNHLKLNHNLDEKDGIDLSFSNKKIKREYILWHFPHYHGSLWKPGSAIRSGDWKLIFDYESNEAKLFDLKEDPSELNDISNLFNEEKERLITELEKMKKETNANAVIVNPKY